uniref:Unannotated protein n=1 Tax=freshwater metagenome TaxID=449393 RepID=A0A6J6A3J5_9ZZZZ
MLALSKPSQAILDDDNRTINDEAEIQSSEAHEVARDVQPVHPGRRHQHRKGNDERGDQRRADIPEYEKQDDDDKERTFCEVLRDCLDRRVDEIGAVINRLRLDTRRQRAVDVGKPCSNRLRDRAGVFTDKHECGSHDRVLAVDAGSTAAKPAADGDGSHIADAHRQAAPSSNDCMRDVVNGAYPCVSLHKEGFATTFDEVRTDSDARFFKRIGKIDEGQAVARELR